MNQKLKVYMLKIKKRFTATSRLAMLYSEMHGIHNLVS